MAAHVAAQAPLFQRVNPWTRYRAIRARKQQVERSRGPLDLWAGDPCSVLIMLISFGVKRRCALTLPYCTCENTDKQNATLGLRPPAAQIHDATMLRLCIALE